MYKRQGLSASCATAQVLAEDFEGRVQVVDNRRISVTQRHSVLDLSLIHISPDSDARQQARTILRDILSSDILTYRPQIKPFPGHDG